MKALRLSLSRLQEEIEAFCADYLKEKGDETKGTYQRALRTFQQYYARAKEWFQFRTEDVEQYKKYLMEEKKLSQRGHLLAVIGLDNFVGEGELPKFRFQPTSPRFDGCLITLWRKACSLKIRRRRSRATAVRRATR